MAFKTFVPLDTLTASEMNTYLMKQVNIVCTSGTRPAAPVEGMVIIETDTDRILIYDGAAWIRIGNFAAAGRTGTRLRRAANQSISNTTVTAISFDTEDADTDAFIAVTASAITIPAGLGGLYGGSGELYVPGGNTGAFIVDGWLSINDNTNRYDSTAAFEGSHGVAPITFGGNRTGVSLSFLRPLAAGDVVRLMCYQSTGGALNVQGRLNLYRLAA